MNLTDKIDSNHRWNRGAKRRAVRFARRKTRMRGEMNCLKYWKKEWSRFEGILYRQVAHQPFVDLKHKEW